METILGGITILVKSHLNEKILGRRQRNLANEFSTHPRKGDKKTVRPTTLH